MSQFMKKEVASNSEHENHALCCEIAGFSSAFFDANNGSQLAQINRKGIFCQWSYRHKVSKMTLYAGMTILIA